MCRFLIVKSKKKIKPAELLKFFSFACQKSIAPDGELQKDGYGIAWQQNDGAWKLKKSLTPIWKEQDRFRNIPESYLFVAHARSAGFSKDKDNIEYNQPFISGKLCFVFNGMIRKISLHLPLKGVIGSQKLFSLIKLQIKKHTLDFTLNEVNKLILDKAEKVEGMNIGLIDNNNISILCQYLNNKKYFTLHYFENNQLTIISSEQFANYRWKNFKNGEIKKF